MGGSTKQKSKQTPVYFGHPFQFWKSRQRGDLTNSTDVDELKKLSDSVYCDRIHMQKAIVNRVEEKVTRMMQQEELNLRHRQQKLKQLLEQEEESLLQELIAKKSMEECCYCKERDCKLHKYVEDIEKEKLMECKKAFEREKITNGMRCTKLDEIQLKKMQKLQMEEKKYIEQEAKEVDKMWHQVLLDDVRRKDEETIRQVMKLKEEMKERRRAYDDQISSANRERRETLRKEREEENMKLENIKQKMEQDYYNAIKNKKVQQMVNRSNFIKGHEMKLSRLRNELNQEREIEARSMKTVAEEIRSEKQFQLDKKKELQQQKTIFVQHHHNERMMAAERGKETDKVIHDWERTLDMREAERKRENVIAKETEKKKYLQDYRQHLRNVNEQTKRKQQERREQMEKVNRAAYYELQRRLNNANAELIKQIAYRNSLTEQIRSNTKIKETELNLIECKEQPFTKKAISFKEAMRDKVNTTLGGESTNPVHPFARALHKRY